MGKKNSDYISVSELAKLVGKSPQWVYKMIKQKPSFYDYIKVIDGHKKVHKSAVWQVFGVEYEGFTSDDKPVETDSKPDTMTILVEQLKNQQQQIESLQRTIEALTDALKAEQILRANADARIKMLEDKQMEPATEKEDATPVTEDKTEEQPKKETEPPSHEPQQQTREPVKLSFINRLRKFVGK